MNTMQPIRSFEMIQNIQDFLKCGRNGERNFVLFSTGIYAPLRISDILPWKVRDVRNKKYFVLREKKTNKEQLVYINDDLKKILDKYIEGKKDYEYLFKSTQKNEKGIYGPITRQQAWNILKKAATEFGIDCMGCHTMRKTFGYHYYQQTGDIVTLQEIFNHSHPSITLYYIGITQDMKNKAIKSFKYKLLNK
ncbi:MAG: tyrosine-type recombinase/integrase [Vallitalea sp.]|jgi:integrase|nr:tyrosine-type recombinase/integrase [Vallitalea sp.]